MKYYIYHTGSIFKVKKEASEVEPYDVGTLSVEYAEGYVEGKFDFRDWDFKVPNQSSYFKFNRFEAENTLLGRISHKHGFGEVWDLKINIRAVGEPEFHSVVFSGGEFTNSFSSMSIARSIIKFLNEIQRFESIDDYNDFSIIKQVNTIRDIEDEILEISKVITLCKKYEEIDPVFPYQSQLREWITNRLNKIIQTL